MRVVRRLDQKWGLVTDSEGRVTTAEQWEAIESAKTVYHGEVGAPFKSAPHMGGAAPCRFPQSTLHTYNCAWSEKQNSKACKMHLRRTS